jgi:hypothetical protein
VPSTWPGARAPHVWLRDGRSILDLFGKGFTLLNLSGIDTARITKAAKRAGLPIATIEIAEPNVRAIYQRNLVLVRPDGHVAWRDDSVPENAAAILDQVRGAL